MSKIEQTDGNRTCVIDNATYGSQFETTVWHVLESDALIILLSVHVLNVVFRPELRNLPGKNLAGFCTTRLLSFVPYVIGCNPHKCSTFCLWIRQIGYYFLISSLSWSSIIAYDVNKTLRKSLKLTPNPLSKQMLEYRRYFIFSTLSPLPMTAFLTVNKLSNLFPPTTIKNTSAKLCCIFNNNLYAVQICLIIPVALIVTVKIVLYADCARMLYNPKRPQQPLLFEYRNKFLIQYCTLAAISSCSSVINALLVLNLDNLIFHIGFVIGNWTIGLYIITVFTYRDRCARLWTCVRIHLERWLYRNNRNSDEHGLNGQPVVLESIRILD